MLPLPKGDSTYTQAKKAEYNRDLQRAVRLYMQAIDENDRKESAIKDVAGLLNQMGCAVQAIDFLEKHKLDSGRPTSNFGLLFSGQRESSPWAEQDQHCHVLEAF